MAPPLMMMLPACKARLDAPGAGRGVWPRRVCQGGPAFLHGGNDGGLVHGQHGPPQGAFPLPPLAMIGPACVPPAYKQRDMPSTSPPHKGCGVFLRSC